MKKKHWSLSLFLILLVVFVNYMGIGLIYPIFASLLFDPKYFFLPNGSSDLYRGFILGVLLALMPLMQFFFSPFLGKKSDQMGRKNILTFCLILSILGYFIGLLGVYTQSLLSLVFFRIFVGISGSGVAIVQAILIDISPDNKAKFLSLFNMAMGAGYAIGPFIGGFFSTDNFLFPGNITYPFWFGLSLTFVNLYLVKKYFYETLKPFHLISCPKITFSFNGPTNNLLLCTFIFSFGWSFFFEFLPIFLMGQYTFSSLEIGNFYAYASLFYMICSAFLIKPLMEKIKSQILLVFSFIFSGFYILLFYSIENTFLLWFYVPLLSYLIAVVFPTTSFLVSNQTHQDQQGDRRKQGDCTR